MACIPLADVLVELACLIEHAAHIRHLAGIPLADVLIEAGGKHTTNSQLLPAQLRTTHNFSHK